MVTTMSDRFGNATPSGSIITTPLIGTSTSSQTVSTSSGLTFSVQTNRAWKPGTRLRVSSTDATKIMEGEVQSYSGSSSLVLEVDYTEGSGSTDSWSLGVAGTRGSSGAQGATGNTGSSGADGNGVATGGMNNDILYKNSTADFSTSWRSLSDQIDAAVTESTGAVLYRASTGWAATAAGSTAQALFGGAAPVFAAINSGSTRQFQKAIFTASTDFIKSSYPTISSDTVLKVTVIAAGNSGGAGGGGGAGGAAIEFLQASALSSAESVTVGAAAGSSSAFGAFLAATGGEAGQANRGGTGGVGSGGDHNMRGQGGSGALGGAGGSAPTDWGGGGGYGDTAGPGSSGGSFGGGGGSTSGAGAPGGVIVEWIG